MLHKPLNTLTVLAIAVILVACQGVRGFAGYQPPAIPLYVSIDTDGKISITIRQRIEVPTPLGTFSAGLVVDPAEYFAVDNTLTVRYDGEDRIFDLHGQDFDVQFSAGNYEQICLLKTGSNVLLELQRATPVPIIVSSALPVNAPPRSAAFGHEDLNALLGAGNWRCIDGYPNAVSIDNLPPNFVVQFPLSRVDARGGFYYEGSTVQVTGYATGWLVDNLPSNTCLTSQLRVTQADINQLLGVGNWRCLTEFPTGVVASNVPTSFVVRSPAMFVDKDNVRYYKDEAVPAGGPATIWFPTNIASECP